MKAELQSNTRNLDHRPKSLCRGTKSIKGLNAYKHKETKGRKCLKLLKAQMPKGNPTQETKTMDPSSCVDVPKA